MSKVHAGQQRQGGSENHFESQVRHTNGRKNKGKKMSEKQRRSQLYAKQAAEDKAKPKSHVPEDVFMSVCHCNGAGTCSVCVALRKGISPTAGKLSGSPRKERDSWGYRRW